jgi:hypothetical protein
MGVTSYSFDGALVHNRRHQYRCNYRLVVGFQFAQLPVRVDVEVSYDPHRRQVRAAIVDWGWLPASNPGLSVGLFKATRERMTAQLDARLWKPWTLASVPVRAGVRDLDVVSLKTNAGGHVHLYAKPFGPALLDAEKLTGAVLGLGRRGGLLHERAVRERVADAVAAKQAEEAEKPDKTRTAREPTKARLPREIEVPALLRSTPVGPGGTRDAKAVRATRRTNIGLRKRSGRNLRKRGG